jgi:thiol-disulfide isomerase/thioredoxin
MKLTAKYFFLAAIAFVAILNTACSQESKTPAKTEITAAATAVVPGFENGVFLPVGITATGEKQPPDFTWEEAGKTMQLSTMLKGKITFLNFWGTWCPPCRAEIPHLIDLHKTYKDRGFNIIGFALERQGDAITNVKNYVTKSGINYRNFPSREYSESFAKKFGEIQFVPTTFVIGRDGKVLETIVGGRDKAAFDEIIRKYIDTK